MPFQPKSTEVFNLFLESAYVTKHKAQPFVEGVTPPDLIPLKV